MIKVVHNFWTIFCFGISSRLSKGVFGFSLFMCFDFESLF